MKAFFSLVAATVLVSFAGCANNNVPTGEYEFQGERNPVTGQEALKDAWESGKKEVNQPPPEARTVDPDAANTSGDSPNQAR